MKIVKMTAIVIDTLRFRPVPSSEATYLSCMEFPSVRDADAVGALAQLW